MLVLLALLTAAQANPVPPLSGRTGPGLNRPITPVTTNRSTTPPPTIPWAWQRTWVYPTPPVSPPLKPPPAPSPTRPVLTSWQQGPTKVENPGKVILFDQLPSAFQPIPAAENHLPTDPTLPATPSVQPVEDPARSEPAVPE